VQGTNKTEIKFTTELESLKQEFNSACLLSFPSNPIVRTILNQSITVHLFTHYLSKTQSNIILPSISRSATWSLLLRTCVKTKSYVFFFSSKQIYRTRSDLLIPIKFWSPSEYHKKNENYTAVKSFTLLPVEFCWSRLNILPNLLFSNILRLITNYSQQDATFLEFIYFYRRTICLRRFLRPSSGAHHCTYSVRYCQQYCCWLLPWRRWNCVPSPPR